MPRPRLVALIAIGLLARVLGLWQWGTYDTEAQKAWSFRAADEGLRDIYGPSDRDLLRRAGTHGHSALVQSFPRTEFEWHGGTFIVDYPPGSVLVLWAAGKLWGLVHTEMPDRPGFNAAINLAPLLASVAIAWMLQRSAVGRLGWRRALVFWLNPAIVLAAPYLGYQDTIFGAFALAAVLALMERRYVWAWALVVAAGLIKPQGALLLPTLLVVTFRESGFRTWMRCLLAGLAVAALIFLPWWGQGHLLSALDGCRRPLTQETLAPLGLNPWWIAGFEMTRAKQGGWPLAPIVSIHEFQTWAGWDPRAVARGLLALATLANLALLARAPREDRRFIPLSVILQVHAYALLATRVHENHTFLAVMLLPLLVGVWPEAGRALALTSSFLFASLFFAVGLGRHVTRIRQVEAIKLSTRLDMSVIVAGLHVVLVLLLFQWVARTRDGARALLGDVPGRRYTLGRDKEASMRIHRRWSALVVLAALGLPIRASALPAPGAATGTLTVGGKSVALTHALAINAGAYIDLLITDQALPPDQVKSEFQLGLYRFQHRVVGVELMLDPEHKVTEMAYLWEAAKKPCPGCFEVTISGGAEGPLTGTLKSTAKALDTEKLKAEVTFNAPFARPSGAKN